jgi:hypothetical protein
MRYSQLDVVEAASYLLDHGINPDDGVEGFMRQHYLHASEQFIAAVAREAVELRDQRRLHWLFEHINDRTPAWPDDKKRDEFAIEIEDDVAHELLRKIRESEKDWEERRRISEGVHAIARYAALLLIEQAAWRKNDDEMKAAEEKFAAEERLA